MKRRKLEHLNNISSCKNYEKDSCHFGDDKCWFKHEAKNIEVGEIVNENPEIIDRIFIMMEKFSERFEYIENQL